MARDWSKSKRTQQARQAAQAAAIDARYLSEMDVAPGPSKSDLRAQAAAAMATFRGSVKRLPMRLEMKCPRCRHRGWATVRGGTERRFCCSRCGHSFRG